MTMRNMIQALFLFCCMFLIYAEPATAVTVGGRISADTTWTLANSPYTVTSTVQVYGTDTTPVTLTIEPGVVVKFNSSVGLQIGSGANQGELIARGSSSNRITFTRSGTSGTWGTLNFQDGTIDATTVIEYVDIQYSTGVTMTSTAPTIRNSTITNLTGYVSLSSSNPMLDTITIANNGSYGIYLSSSSPTITNGSLTNSSATGHGIYGSGSPIISNYSVSIVNSALKYGAYFSSTSSALSITNSTIANGLYIASTGITPTITGNTFMNVDNSPIRAGANIIAQILTVNTISGMTAAGKIEVVGEQVKQDAHWTVWPAPYVVVSYMVSVYKDTTSPATLTIDPGVTIMFASGAGLTIGNGTSQGALVAQGTVGNHITFTRSGTTGTWSGINFQDGTIDSTTDLEYVDVQYSSGVTMTSASPAIRNSTITSVTGYGLSLSFSNPVVDTVTIANNGAYGIYLTGSSPVITNGSLTNSSATGHGIYGSGSPVLSNYSISIVNTVGKYGAYFSSSTSGLSITNSTIVNGLYIGSTSITPTVTGNTFTNSDSSPVHAGANIIGQIMNNNTVNNMTAAGRIEVVGEQINQDARWQKWAAPYVVVSGTVSVYKNISLTSTLTMDPGVTVKFSTSTAFQVGSGSSRGVLVARGTADNKILFTSSQATPAPGNWNGVTLSGDTSSASDIEYMTIEYAGSGTNYNNANLTINSSAPVLRNCLIRNSAGSGVYITSSSSYPVIIDSEISGNKWGVYASLSNPYITNTRIYSNTTYGVYNATTTMDVDARDNWWGAATGPLYSGNSRGTGDKINDHVLYNPWLGQAPGATLSLTDAKVLPTSLNPDGDYVMFTASISSSATWTITITDSNNSVVQTFSGSGTSINQQWYGENDQAVKVADGAYYYQMSAVDPASGNIASAPQGLVMVSRQLPIAILTLPTDNQMLTGGTTINITGTASDFTDFKNYSLDYGVGENPASWTSLKSSTTTSVTNGLLYAWNTTNFAGSLYSVRLTVTDNAGNVAVETSRVRLLWIQNAASSESFISPNEDSIKDSTLVSAAFTYQSNWTLTIKDSSNTAIRTYTGAGTSMSQAWDGKDGQGAVVPDGTYVWQIDAVSTETNIAAASKTGNVIVDVTTPAAQITSPAANAAVQNVVPVIGTASDVNLDTYKIEYGPAAEIGPWSLISSATTTVVNGTLTTWVTNDSTNAVLLANGGYALRLTVNDKAGNTTIMTQPVTMGNLIFSNIDASSHTINTENSEAGTVFFTINASATVTMKVVPEKQGPSGTPVYQTSQNIADAGAASFTWNGKDSTGKIVPDDAYLYILEATDGTRTDVYSVAAPTGTGSLSCSQSAYDPYKNEPMTISYAVDQPERVNLKVAWGANPEFSVLSDKAHVPGTYTFDWDGKDTQGVIRAIGGVARCAVASLLSENHIITSGDAVQITGVKTDPYEMHLAYGQFTRIGYTISKDAMVSISLVAPSGATLTLEAATMKSFGAHEFTWNGLDATDATGKKILVSGEGYYVVSIQAVNQSTGALTIARGSLKIGN